MSAYIVAWKMSCGVLQSAGGRLSSQCLVNLPSGFRVPHELELIGGSAKPLSKYKQVYHQLIHLFVAELGIIDPGWMFF